MIVCAVLALGIFLLKALATDPDGPGAPVLTYDDYFPQHSIDGF